MNNVGDFSTPSFSIPPDSADNANISHQSKEKETTENDLSTVAFKTTSDPSFAPLSLEAAIVQTKVMLSLNSLSTPSSSASSKTKSQQSFVQISAVKSTLSHVSSNLKQNSLDAADYFTTVLSKVGHGISQSIASDAHYGSSLSKGFFTLSTIALRIATAISSSCKLKKETKELVKDTKELQVRLLITKLFPKETPPRLLNETNYTKIQAKLNEKEYENGEKIVFEEVFPAGEDVELTYEKEIELQATIAVREKNIKTYTQDLRNVYLLPKNFLDLAAKSIQFSASFGKKLHTVSSFAVSHLATVGSALGTVAGALAIAFNIYEITKNIKTAYNQYKKMNQLDQQISRTIENITNLSITTDNIEGKKEVSLALFSLQLIALHKERALTKIQFTHTLFLAGTGVLGVAAGALGVATIFTGGIAGLALAGVTVGLGIIATGVKIGLHIQKRNQEQKIEEAINKMEPRFFKDVIQQKITNKKIEGTELVTILSDMGISLSPDQGQNIFNRPDLFLQYAFKNIA